MSITENNVLMFTVKGDSMTPTLYDGDKVITCKQSCYKNGDIIVYLYRNKQLFIHRIIAMSENSMICRGDNNRHFERVKKNDVIGKVIWIKRR